MRNINENSFLKMQKTVNAESVLGCLLKDPKVGRIVVESLSSEDFIDPTHKKLFAAAKEIVGSDDEPSRHAIAGFLTDKELVLIGGMATLDRLERNAPHPAKVVFYINAVKEQTMRKKLYRGLDRAKEILNSMGNTKEALKEISVLSREVSAGIDNEDGDILKAYEAWLLEPEVPGVRTGFRELDDLTGGFKPGTMWVVAAYLGTGNRNTYA